MNKEFYFAIFFLIVAVMNFWLSKEKAVQEERNNRIKQQEEMLQDLQQPPTVKFNPDLLDLNFNSDGSANITNIDIDEPVQNKNQKNPLTLEDLGNLEKALGSLENNNDKLEWYIRSRLIDTAKMYWEEKAKEN